MSQTAAWMKASDTKGDFQCHNSGPGRQSRALQGTFCRRKLPSFVRMGCGDSGRKPFQQPPAFGWNVPLGIFTHIPLTRKALHTRYPFSPALHSLPLSVSGYGPVPQRPHNPIVQGHRAIQGGGGDFAPRQIRGGKFRGAPWVEWILPPPESTVCTAGVRNSRRTRNFAWEISWSI